MTHRERVMALLRGEEVDRPPVALWRHFYSAETTPEGLARATLEFQRRYDWDFVKLNPRASYHAEGWGLKVRYQGDSPPEVVETPVKRPQDWDRLEPLPLERGVLAEHLRALEAVVRGVGEDTPVLMTVFTPLSIAGRLTPSPEVFPQHLREHPERVREGLEVVTDTFTRFARACLERGASGLFYATTHWATRLVWAEEDYQRWARPYDLRLLEALPPAPFHLLHVCREHNMLPLLADYPVHALNWDAWGRGNPSLAQGMALAGGRAVVGGLPHRQALLEASPGEVRATVRALAVALGRQGWMLGPGCTVSPQAGPQLLQAVREAVETL